MNFVNSKSIIIKLQVEGTHKWEQCPIDEVSYLRNEHRHIFHIEMHKEVNHNERDIEIIQFKKQVIENLTEQYYAYDSKLLEFGNMSCESIAEQLLNEHECHYVSVLEDNENGASIKREKEC